MTEQVEAAGAAVDVDVDVEVAGDAASEPEGENVVLLRGEVAGDPEVRILPSGTVMMTLSVRVPGRAGRRTSLPVTVWDPGSAEESLGAGDAVEVQGSLLRRFWAGGDGSRRSRVEIVAGSVTPC